MHLRLVPCRRSLPVPAWAVAVAAGWGSVVLAASFAAGTGSGPSTCLLHRVAGIPCPTCGGTRATRHVLAGDLSAALVANPLVTIGLLCVVLLVGLRVAAARAPRLGLGPAGRRCLWGGALALVALDWAYLLLRGA